MRPCHLLLLAPVLAACSQRSDPPATDRAPTPPPVASSSAPTVVSAEPSRTESAAAKILNEPTLAGVVAMLRPAFKDRQGEADPATDILVAWGRRHGVDRAQLLALPETSFDAFRKDPAAERGKRLCAAGTLIELRKNGDMHSGGLLADKDVLTTLAIGDTGSLAEDSKARFCGVATGLFTYKSSSGVVVESIRAVGAFDLPGGPKPGSSAR